MGRVGEVAVKGGGGPERSNVVDVPRERIASPEAESATIAIGLSPVKGAMMYSVPYLHELLMIKCKRITDRN